VAGDRVRLVLPILPHLAVSNGAGARLSELGDCGRVSEMTDSFRVSADDVTELVEI
jgi:hypothetical protein